MSNVTFYDDFFYRPTLVENTLKTNFENEAILIATKSVYNQLTKKLKIDVPLIESAMKNPFNEYELTPRDVFNYNVGNAITTRLMETTDEKLLTDIDKALFEARLELLGGIEMITATLYQKLIKDTPFLTDLNRDNMWEKFIEARRCYQMAHQLPDNGLHIEDTPAREILKPKRLIFQMERLKDEKLNSFVAKDADDPYWNVVLHDIPEDASNFCFHEIPKGVTISEHKAFTNKYGCKDAGHNGSQRPWDHKINKSNRITGHKLVKCDRRYLKKYQKFVNKICQTRLMKT